MKQIAIVFALLGAAICGFVAWRELVSPAPRLIELASLVILTMTLIVLVWYAYDTNLISRITSERWTKEGILATTYSISLPGASVGDSGRTVFQLTNGSTLVVRANVRFNLKVYGQPVSAGSLYDGSENWLLYPHQQSQGVFEIDRLLQQQGKTVSTMRAELTDACRMNQLTMVLELTYTDEFSATRTLPPRQHYFDFKDWAWIPSLGERTHT